MDCLVFATAGFATITVPLLFGFSALHGIALGLFILLLAALYQIDALGGVVSELMRDMRDMTEEVEHLSGRVLGGSS